jgi:peptidoglycan/LPS O-acetylase OafA/YrhL
LRRAVRLDPPYWMSIAAIIVIGLIAAKLVGTNPKEATIAQVLSHLVYLQDFLGYEQLLVVYWTLCYEIQFYLALILLLWLGQALRMTMPVIAISLVLSMIDRHMEFTGDAFMGRFWFCFAIGALVYWAYSGALKASWTIAALVLVKAFGLYTQDGYAITASLTASILFAVISLGCASFGSSAPLQFLGRISYSLYLTHLIGGWLVMTIALKFLPPWAAIVIGVAASIVGAWVFYLIVESPAVRLSKRVRVDMRRDLTGWRR